MRTATIVLAALVTAAFAVPSSAFADVTPISVGQGKPFKHKPSGIVVAADIAGGIPRVGVAQYDDKQLDVIIDYRTADQREITTVYVFRNVTGDVSVWFDRIRRTVESSDRLGTIKVAVPPTAFTPTGQTNPRALRTVYSASGAGFTSSAAALTGTGEWYVAIRASSKSLAPDQLLARLEQSFASIQWPKEKAATPSAAPIADCSKPLAQGEDAQLAESDSAMMVAGALVAASDALKTSNPMTTTRWCRDPFKTEGAGVYRANEAGDRYLIAFQDAGRGILVGPNETANLIATELNKEPSYAVELIEIDHHSGFGTFKTLPNVAQALWTIQHGERLYDVATWGKDRTIEINSNLK